MKCFNLFFSSALLLTASQVVASDSCPSISNIEGVYQCGGECITTTDLRQKTLTKVSGEVSTISAWPGSTLGLYQVHIKAGNGFREVEIGSLVGNKMNTATAKVSDNHYPVLEEYTFTGDSKCNAKQFTKTVLNPSLGNFKACTIICIKKQI